VPEQTFERVRVVEARDPGIATASRYDGDDGNARLDVLNFGKREAVAAGSAEGVPRQVFFVDDG
jgi:hypothetical protein